MALAPIVLFTYNRPDHTLRTLEALKKNILANQSLLFIYCDGAKENASQEVQTKIKEVRAIVRSEKWCKEVQIIERKKNWGLADNILDGVTEIVNNYGKIIVLEDDIYTSPGFLSYMNQALDLYQAQERVMHISGYMFPIDTQSNASTFFYTATTCWGWATYKRSWKLLIRDPKLIWNYLEENDLFDEFNLGGYANFSRQLRQNIEGTIKTWAIKWHSSVFINKGLCLHPHRSLVQNIGNDNSGTNSANTDYHSHQELEQEVIPSSIPLKESLAIRNKMSDYYYTQKKLKHFIYKSLKPILPKKLRDTPF